MNVLTQSLQQQPELAVFLCLALGYALGSVKVRGFNLGTVVGTLVVALVVGQAGVQVPGMVRTMFFMLFMFATGYRIGPQFFQGLRRGGMQLAALSVVFCVVGLVVIVVTAKVLGLDPGLASGLVAGALTQSSVYGSATDAIMRLNLPEATRQTLASHVAISGAVTYLFGMMGATIFGAKLAPKMIRANVRAECETMETELGGAGAAVEDGAFEGYVAVDLQAFRISEERWAGRTVAELIQSLPERVFVQRMRRGRRLFVPRVELALRAGDTLVLSGTRDHLLIANSIIGRQVVDAEAMDFPIETVPVIVATAAARGCALRELAQLDPGGAKGVHLRRVLRQGQVLPRLPQTRIERGDVLELVGRREDLERVIPLLGVAERPTEKSDIIFIGIACMVGIAIGAGSILVSGVPVSLGATGGVLIAGLLFGWLHALQPRFGRIPAPAVWLMETLGLNTFVAVVGLGVGAQALDSLKSDGLNLFLAGIGVTLVPAVVTVLVGRYLLRMNAGILLGGLAGASTVVATLKTLQDDTESAVPALGFTVPYAISNVLLTAWGPVLVGLLAEN